MANLNYKSESNINPLLTFWDSLKKIRYLRLHAQFFKNEQQEIKLGKAEVQVQIEQPYTLIFNEKGIWESETQHPIEFKNTYRFNLDLEKNLIRIEHLRFGKAKPVFLFDMRMRNSHELICNEPHHCNLDTYFAKCTFTKSKITFEWKIAGPQKNQVLTYEYTP